MGASGRRQLGRWLPSLPFAQLLYHWLWLKATHVSIPARNVAGSFQRPKILRATLDCPRKSLAGLIKANLGDVGSAAPATPNIARISRGRGNLPPGFLATPRGALWASSNQIFPAEQIPSDFSEQSSLRELQLSYLCTGLPATLSAQDPRHSDNTHADHWPNYPYKHRAALLGVWLAQQPPLG